MLFLSFLNTHNNKHLISCGSVQTGTSQIAADEHTFQGDILKPEHSLGGGCLLFRQGNKRAQSCEMYRVLFCSTTSNLIYFKDFQIRKELAPVTNMISCISHIIKLHPDVPIWSSKASNSPKCHSSSQEHKSLNTAEVNELLSDGGRRACCVSPLTKANVIMGNLFPEVHPTRWATHLL